MAGQRGLLLAVAALLAPALAGCLDPYRAHVDEAVLSRATLAWSRADHPQVDGGLFGVKTLATDYTHSASSPPPFPAVLVVFSLRAVSRPSTEELLRYTHLAVDNETQARGIRIDQSQSSSGHRALASGVQTEFFTEEGTSATGGLFPQNTKVRIIGEVGYDGRSSTSIVVVGIAQVEASRTCPLNLNCGVTHDEGSWVEMVGDGGGSVGGATLQTGLIDHLVTHG
ncbi:MAG: hypothetical protein QOG31_611 [Thermoplasmata archaeon]|jgi:hypothetical protein|nr:hypothetical protein [Thermoplasmata archaeon]